MKLKHVLLATVLVSATPSFAFGKPIQVSIPAQSLEATLFEIARTSGLQLVYTEARISRVQAPTIAGSLTLEQMLDRALAKTGFTYQIIEGRTIRIVSEATMRKLSYAADDDQQGGGGYSAPAGESSAAAAPEEPAEPIVIIGSQIKGSKLAGTLPVTTLDETAIRNTGATSGDELFRSIPQMGDVSFNSAYLPNSSNAARGDVGSVNLRNLGVGNTLVLLNGRRVVAHPTSRADDNLVPVLTFNTNALPVFGIERLEVLRDGAAAIYGSDAIAGVVNTVLQNDYDGFMIEGQRGLAEGTNLEESTVNLLFGQDLGSRGNITFSANYSNRTALNARDQDYTASADKRPLFADTRFADSTSLDGRSSITPWGSFQTLGNVRVRQGTVALTNTSGQFHIQPLDNAGCQTNATTGLKNGLCIDDGTNTAAADRNLRFDQPLAYNTTVMPKVERLNLFSNGHYDIGATASLFFEAGYYKADSTSVQSSPATLSSQPLVIPANSYYNPFGPTTLNGSANPNRLPNLNTTDVPALGRAITLSSYNFSDTGPTLVEVRNEQYRGLFGIRFGLAGFDWESAALYSEASVRDTQDGVSQTLLQAQLAKTTPDAYNPFNGGNLLLPQGADGVPSNQAAIDAIKIKTVRYSKSTLALADLKGSNASLFALPGGDVGLAIGAEVRRETQLDDRDPRVDGTIQFTDMVNGTVNGSDLIGTSPSPDTSGRRTVFGAYGELAIPLVSPSMNIPLVHRAELQIAGRFENYSDAGSVAKPKFAASWDLVEGIRIRGSYAEGFKAPNLEQVNATVVTRSNTRTDYVRCEADLRAGRIANFAACTQRFATVARRSGNPDLKPEESRSWSLGAVLQPHFLDGSLGRITITFDYWNIKQTGIVGLFGEGNALINDYLLRVGGSSDPNVVRAAPTADDVALYAGTGLTPAGQVLYVTDKYVNLLPQEVAGYDIGLNWALPDYGFGRIVVAANAAYLDKYFLTPSPPIQELLDAREAGTINAGTAIGGGGDLVRQNGKPQWKASGSLTWSYDKFQIGAYTQYTGSVEDTGLIDAAGVPWEVADQMTFNLYAQVELTQGQSNSFRFRVGVRNLTNEKPPLSPDGYLASLYNPYARYWYANARVSF